MKFFKVSALASVFILLWSVNSFVFSDNISELKHSVVMNQQNTHLIPLMVVNGHLVRLQDLTNIPNVCSP